LTTSRVVIFALAMVTAAAAQDYIPAEISSRMNNEKPAAEAAFTSTVATAPLPEAPTPHRVVDKKFVIVMAALGGAETMRFTSRKLVLDNEFAAGAPWVTHVPANSHLVAEYSGLYAAELLVAYEMKKPHSWLPGDRVIRKFWLAYPAAMTTIHVKNAVGNIRTQGPGGCTSIECAEQQMP